MPPATPAPSPAPALTVAAIVERTGRFLCVEELIAGRRVINQPAGHVEPGETPAQAVIREALEETAWHFRPTAVVGIYLWRPPEAARPYLRVALCGDCTAHEAGRALDTGILQAVWLERDELLARAGTLRSPMVMRCLDDYRAGQRLAPALAECRDPAELLRHAIRL